jgi:cytochrome P450
LDLFNEFALLSQDMFLGGTETSSTVLDWAIAGLLRNPRVMKKAQAEVRQVFCTAGNVDETDLEKLKYLELVVKETLRLHPPLSLLLPRESREDCEINGFKIPAKIKVVINVWAIGRDPAYWNEPEKIPSREIP